MRPPFVSTAAFFVALWLGGCASTIPATKPWHVGWAAPQEVVYDKTHNLEASGRRDAHGEPIFNAFWSPRLPPFVDYSKLRQVKVGDRGEGLYALTRPLDPVYRADGAVVRTSIAGIEYEAAFHYSRSRAGVIDDISFRPTAALSVPDPNVAHSY